jgi:drug/metabolite transporter (DMT)-like permease
MACRSSASGRSPEVVPQGLTPSGQAVGLALALVSAVTTAIAHSLLKQGADKLAVRAVIGLTAATAMIVPAALSGAPPAPLRLWLLGAVVLHALYQLVLIESYRLNDFSLAFPIARGVAPLLAALGAIVVLGERPSLVGLAGIGAICGGVLLFAPLRHLGRRVLFFACLAGFLTALYTVVDAGGVREGGSAFDFIVWFFVLDGLTMTLIFLLARSAGRFSLLRAEMRRGAIAGVMTLASFGSALVALRLAPVGMVAALRETSVLVSVFIGVSLLGEPLSRRKLGGAAAIALGAGLVFRLA